MNETTTREEPAGTRERILAATLELWNERGFGAVRVAEIAARVGISNGNLSYHFPAKRDLVLALWDRGEKAHLALVQDWQPATALAELPGWIRGLCRVMWEYRFLYRDTPQLVAEAPELARRSRDTLIQEGAHQLRSCLEAIAAAGQLEAGPDELPRVVTNGWILLRHWIDYLVEARAVVRIERAHVDELVDQYAALLRPHLTPAARAALAAALVTPPPVPAR